MIKFVYVTGSIEFFDYEKAKAFIEDSIAEIKETNVLIFVSGGRHGAESAGRRYAREMGYRLELFASDFKNDGEDCLWLKTKKLLEISDLIIYIGSGSGFGEKEILDYVKAIDKPIRKRALKSVTSVVNYDEMF